MQNYRFLTDVKFFHIPRLKDKISDLKNGGCIYHFIDKTCRKIILESLKSEENLRSSIISLCFIVAVEETTQPLEVNHSGPSPFVIILPIAVIFTIVLQIIPLVIAKGNVDKV